MFQIPEMLGTLSLSADISTTDDGGIGYNDNSSSIFSLLANLGSRGSENKDPSNSWISMLGLKNLSVSWVDSDTSEVIAFLQKAPAIEEICLMGVSQAVLEAFATTLAETRLLQSLKILDVHWVNVRQYESEEALLVVQRLEDLGL